MNLFSPKLQQHYHDMKAVHLRELFSQNRNRHQEFTFYLDSFVFDLSKNFILSETINLLVETAKQVNLEQKIDDFFSGKKINFTEQKAVLHHLLRQPVSTLSNLHQDVSQRDLLRALEFAEKIRNQEILGFSKKPFTDIVNIGVGGSGLGPKLLCRALSYQENSFNLHFVEQLDGEHLANILKILNPETTLFVIASKSFQTLDTKINMETAMQWFHQNVDDSYAFKKHFIGVSALCKGMDEAGIDKEYQFLISDAVGGRYSIWSPVSLIAMIAYGKKQFMEFLAGGYYADQHFRNTTFSQNIPVLLGLLDVWYTNFFNLTAHAIFPYSSYLNYLPAYLQQLFMESLGKQVNSNGQQVEYGTGQMLFGDLGFVAQHAFFQLLHQGTKKIFCDFIVPIEEHHSFQKQKNLAFASALAQAHALMYGHIPNDESPLKPHLVYPGNRPSTFILFPKITPYLLGLLLAVYEHRVFVQAALWDINPYDQWGVENGKKITNQVIHCLQQQKSNTSLFADDRSSENLLSIAQKWINQ